MATDCTRLGEECDDCGRPKCKRCGRCKRRWRSIGGWIRECPAWWCRWVKFVRRVKYH